MNQFSAKAFQRKIDAFCQLRLSPLFKEDELPRLKWYMHTLIQTRRLAARTSGKTDWDVVAAACGVDANLLADNARQIDPAFDAIARWIRDTRLSAPAVTSEVRQTQTTPRTKAGPSASPPASRMPKQPTSARPVTAVSYGRFLPQDKAALAARILNQVWEAA